MKATNEALTDRVEKLQTAMSKRDILRSGKKKSMRRHGVGSHSSRSVLAPGGVRVGRR